MATKKSEVSAKMFVVIDTNYDVISGDFNHCYDTLKDVQDDLSPWEVDNIQANGLEIWEVQVIKKYEVQEPKVIWVEKK